MPFCGSVNAGEMVREQVGRTGSREGAHSSILLRSNRFRNLLAPGSGWRCSRSRKGFILLGFFNRRMRTCLFIYIGHTSR